MAGDIGHRRAAEVLAILKTFACPIIFVNGNWDEGGEAVPLRGRWLKSAHLRVVRMGELNFMGYSYYTLWSVGRRDAASLQVHAECRAALRNLVNRRGLDLRECVLVTHDRAAHLVASGPERQWRAYSICECRQLLRHHGSAASSSVCRVSPGRLCRAMSACPFRPTTCSSVELRFARDPAGLK